MLNAAREEILNFPGDVRCDAAYALRIAEEGGKHPAAKPLQGFGGASVLEIVLDDSGDTYRAVYTVQFDDVTVLLHAFQKKSTKGIKTPKHNIDLVKARLAAAKKLFGEKP
ncbi:MAG TPA: type II toxin-antitoxin system RelE/ParE family toxin [Xanthomonadaceae bacterium]|nr:type II toxin-antitoxin system RelE/ParE family toxin [Xanthomonadaceae bacterium]